MTLSIHCATAAMANERQYNDSITQVYPNILDRSDSTFTPILLFGEPLLTNKVAVLPSYRNQSTDLLCKSIDWFLYEGNTET